MPVEWVDEWRGIRTHVTRPISSHGETVDNVFPKVHPSFEMGMKAH